jgi:hypothetical protein
MRLSIVNYGTSINPEVPKYAKMEDNALIKVASGIIEEKNMPKGAIVVSEVMHTDLVNFNNRSYVQKGLPEAVKSFYYPHFTPFLMHHEMGGGGLFGGGKPDLISVGTNLMAQMYRRKIETPTGIASGYVKVATFVPETSMVGNQNAIDALQSRQLMTLSIGSRVSDEDYRCSICNKSLYDEECDHSLGKEYEGEKCHAKVYNPLFREYSAVYNPSDINAVVRRMDVMEGEGYIEGEEHQVDKNYGGYVAIYDTMNGVFPSVNMGAFTGKDIGGSDIPSKETPAKEVKDMSNTAKVDYSDMPEDLLELIEVSKTAKRELAAKDKKIKNLERLVNVLAVALKEKLEGNFTTVQEEEEVPEDVPAEEDNTPQSEEPESDVGEDTNDDPSPEGVETASSEELPEQEEPSGEDIEEETPGEETTEEVPEGDDNGSQEESTDEGAQGNETPEDSDVQSEDGPEGGSQDITEDGPESPEEEGSGGQESALSYKEILVKRRSLNSIKIGSKHGRGDEGKRPLPRRFKI